MKLSASHFGRASGTGWLPDIPDIRDLPFPLSAGQTPKTADLRAQCPGVYAQGSLGSCTANACGFLHEFVQRAEGKAAFTPSRLLLYYETRVLLGTVNEDSGGYIRDAFKVLAKIGAAPEKLWPYAPAKFKMKAPASAYAEAEKNQALKYRRVQQSEGALRSALAAGYPVAFGISLYSSFDAVRRTGVATTPTKAEKLKGGHAIALVGYDATAKTFTMRNSWGPSWGARGYCTLPFDYVLNPDLAADFWTLSAVE
jgi:C1A family cysteine protease